MQAEVEKNSNENSASLLRRFTKRVRTSGVLPKVRKQRFFSRPASKFRKKATALKTMAKTKELKRMEKLGKLPTR